MVSAAAPSSCDGAMAVTAIGVSWMDSSRRRALTMISSIPLSPTADPLPAGDDSCAATVPAEANAATIRGQEGRSNESNAHHVHIPQVSTLPSRALHQAVASAQSRAMPFRVLSTPITQGGH